MNQEIYALENQNDNECQSIFLAGPTPRDHLSPSWRPEIIKFLREAGFTGDIFIPEKRGDYLDYEYGTHTRWEVEHLNKATLILFWIPRDLNLMPAFTSNIEFGEFMHSGKIILGYPELAPKMRYLKERCEMHKINYVHTIKDLIEQAMGFLKEKEYPKVKDFGSYVIITYKSGNSFMAIKENLFNKLIGKND